MRRYLLVALWPAGLAAITAATVVAARRASPAAAAAAGRAGTQPARAAGERSDGSTMSSAPADSEHMHRDGQPGQAARGRTGARAARSDLVSLLRQPARDRIPDTLLRRLAAHAGGTIPPALRQTSGPADDALSAARRRPPGQAGGAVPAALRRARRGDDGQPDWVSDLIKLGACSAASGALSYAVMALLGPSVMKYGPAIDEPVFRWTNDNQVDWWAAILWRLNKIGNTWTTWGAAGTAGVCLGVSWRRKRWLPPAALAAAIVVDHYATLALRYTFNRLGPPTSPLGTYPAGGTDRIILFYGLIAHLLWREFSGSPRGKACGIGAVAALAFNQAYCREYLSRHWFTDIISGLLYGVVLLLPFMAATRLIAGPVDVATDRERLVLRTAAAS
jgi:hypothetical protein